MYHLYITIYLFSHISLKKEIDNFDLLIITFTTFARPEL